MGSIVKVVEALFGFVKGAFSEGDSPSSARLIMGISTLYACHWVNVIVARTGTLPDATTLIGLVTFTTAAFTVGKITKS